MAAPLTALITLLQDNVGKKNAADWINRSIAEDQNPFSFVIVAAHKVIFPGLGSSSIIQVWWLVALFIVSMGIALAGLILRLQQGRFWLVHRIDSRITMPNISIQNSFWAFMYSALSIVALAMTTRIAAGTDYSSWYVNFGSLLPLVLFMGQYAEIWASCSSYFIRRTERHEDDPLLVSICFMLLPFTWPLVAIIPPLVGFTIAAQNLHQIFAGARKCVSNLHALSAAWVPGMGTDNLLAQLTEGLGPLHQVLAYGLAYTIYTQLAFGYMGSILAITFVLYIIASVVEVMNLRRQSHKLRLQTQVGVARPPQRLSFPPKLTLNSAAGTVSSEPAFNGFQMNCSGDDALTSQLKLQASLIEWATTNRVLTAIPVSLMLLFNSGLSFWSAAKPIHLGDDYRQVQEITIVAGWINVSLSTIVAVLILFRSLSGSPEVTLKVKNWAPWLPLAPINTSPKTTFTAQGPLTMTYYTDSIQKSPFMSADGSQNDLKMPDFAGTVSGITIKRERQVSVDDGTQRSSV
ncbi:BZ3500_MvSof-1268-A1-R1_Chr7-1g09111 [Microbotryum saponariae]|uniref:BZ3500_MvSof-1268-A1-R1_Chr7-1g09111 protein n=1 Tax=Microbotryum saponariae TaxID=289078 RepID=A0A2X0LQ86_9BASI|nr:BZ3501_MvSof-1269-A2-R1_Chr7-1g08816 [Microbotryum saponariae]SDA02823.1 BZ3500_MvSof-1268-A1-R1_Chr7-1g09111 [Microbotryum saponariae]